MSEEPVVASARRVPSDQEMLDYPRANRNWGRWGDDDQRGAVNLITMEKRAQAAGLVRSGRIVSLSRDVPKRPGPTNPQPAQHFMRTIGRPGGGGSAFDYYGLQYHGWQTTHFDALCHIWDEQGMWGGREPQREVRTSGTRWGGVEQFRDGIVTRGVLLDVPRFRDEPFVTLERPVHGWELEEIASAQGVTLEPGDALFVCGGRERWTAAMSSWNPVTDERPGLHPSCLPFMRERDIAVLGWDLMDAGGPISLDFWGVHSVLYAFGVALLDNCLLEPLADACAAEERYEFMLAVSPLPVIGGTGSPVNPIALF